MIWLLVAGVLLFGFKVYADQRAYERAWRERNEERMDAAYLRMHERQ